MLSKSKHIAKKAVGSISKRGTTSNRLKPGKSTSKIRAIEKASSIRHEKALTRKKVIMKKAAAKKGPQSIDKMEFGKINSVTVRGKGDDGRSLKFTFNLTHKNELLKTRNPAYSYFTLS